MEQKRTVRFADSPQLDNNQPILNDHEVKDTESKKDLGYKSLRQNYSVKIILKINQNFINFKIKKKKADKTIFKIHRGKHSTKESKYTILFLKRAINQKHSTCKEFILFLIIYVKANI